MIKKVLQLSGILALLTVSVFVGLLCWRLYTIAPTIDRIVANIDAATFSLAAASDKTSKTIESLQELADQYQKQLSSDRNRKALDASIQAAAAWKGTAQLINTTTVPQLNRTLRALELTVDETGKVAVSAKSAIDTTEKVIGSLDQVIAAATIVTTKAGNAVDQLSIDEQRTARQVEAALIQALEIEQRLTTISDNFAIASESAPSIARSLEKLAGQAPLWRKILGVVTIAAALVGAFK